MSKNEESRKRFLELLGRLPQDKKDLRIDLMDWYKDVKQPEKVLVRDASADMDIAVLRKKISQIEKDKEGLLTQIRGNKTEIEDWRVAAQRASIVSHLNGCFCSVAFAYDHDTKLAMHLAIAGIKTYAMHCKKVHEDPEKVESGFIEVAQRMSELLANDSHFFIGILLIADEEGILSKQMIESISKGVTFRNKNQANKEFTYYEVRDYYRKNGLMP